jgi:hypothetical protein
MVTPLHRTKFIETDLGVIETNSRSITGSRTMTDFVSGAMYVDAKIIPAYFKTVKLVNCDNQNINDNGALEGN